MTPNPYQPPAETTEPDVSQSATTANILSRIAPLPCLPWRLWRVAADTPHWLACLVGYAAITVQLGVGFSPDVGSIAEPYRDVVECLTETLAAVLPCLIFASFVALLPYALALSIRRSGTRTFMLGCWASMTLYVPWIICRFSRVLDSPSYGIIVDNRPDWMTHPMVLFWGLFICWPTVLLANLIAAVVVTPRKFDEYVSTS